MRLVRVLLVALNIVLFSWVSGSSPASASGIPEKCCSCSVEGRGFCCESAECGCQGISCATEFNCPFQCDPHQT